MESGRNRINKGKVHRVHVPRCQSDITLCSLNTPCSPATMSIPTREQFDNYVTSVEELIVSSYEFVTDLDAINDSVHRLWMHVSRFGPPEMPDIRLPTLGRYEIPAPPPPPPPPPCAPVWYEDMTDWASRNKSLIGAMCVGALGAGLLAGYSASTYAKARARLRRTEKTIGSGGGTRRLVVGELVLSRIIIC